jgi:hypothetical protein
MEQKIGSILPEAVQHHEAGCSNALNRAKLSEEEEEEEGQVHAASSVEAYSDG